MAGTKKSKDEGSGEWGGARKGAGRPAKTGRTVVTIATSIPAPLAGRLSRKAEVEGVSKSQVVTNALEEALLEGHYPNSGTGRRRMPTLSDFDTFEVETARNAYALQLKKLGAPNPDADARKLLERWVRMPLRERRMRLLFGYLYRGDGMFYDDIGRELFVTTIPGAHNGPAGYVITMQGTPPKGTFYILTRDQPLVNDEALFDSRVTFATHDGQAIIGNDAYRAIVFDYLRPFRETDFTEPLLKAGQHWVPLEAYDEDQARAIVSVCGDVVTYADNEGQVHDTDVIEFGNWIRQYEAELEP